VRARIVASRLGLIDPSIQPTTRANCWTPSLAMRKTDTTSSAALAMTTASTAARTRGTCNQRCMSTSSGTAANAGVITASRPAIAPGMPPAK
jgi:hypothetical protein